MRLAQLDLAVKGGSRLDPRLELELALAEISAGMNAQTAAAAVAALVSLACTGVIAERLAAAAAAARRRCAHGRSASRCSAIADAGLWYGAWHGWGEAACSGSTT